MTTLTITVTKEILEKSKMCGLGNKGTLLSESCAIAVAVRDIFPAATVSHFYMMPFGCGRDCEEIPLPKEASEFIIKFDALPPLSRPLLEPISFDVFIPDRIIERIDISEVKPLLENHPTLKLQTV